MFKFSQKSLSKLEGVHPELVKVIKRSIELTPIDFTILEGLRSLEQQRINVSKGVSQTMNSKHLKQSDGLGHAVDIVPLVEGKVTWDWNYYYPMISAVCQSAQELGIEVIWGGNWTTPLNNAEATPEGVKKFNQQYVDGRKKQGKSSFIDAPHIQIV